ncbi:hypothetical protein ASC95_08655 [Pelomonas sp. Root1217]|uniref:hypothetical protein n=1 Tax=Pelomonas sp. Root1217 TaxID=1736430 RepID=UPI00070E7A63|nr:hypothetical protein [Pelomonas sp. Root1217]KQV52859.1 hypothetical protein ASC95_08655 [Pelomonas sp. Root1217]
MDNTTKEWFDPSTVKVERTADVEGWQTDEELVRLSGAPKGSVLRVSVNDKGAIELRVSNPSVLGEDMVRVLVQEADGFAFHIVNAVFVLKEELLARGIGPRSVTIELLQAKALGYITRVKTWAIGNRATFEGEPPLRGYYVWPLMGFDAPVPAELLTHPGLPPALPEPPTLQGLFETEAGEGFWLKHGDSLWVEFDLREGSTSWKRLARYTSERNIDVQP